MFYGREGVPVHRLHVAVENKKRQNRYWASVASLLKRAKFAIGFVHSNFKLFLRYGGYSRSSQEDIFGGFFGVGFIGSGHLNALQVSIVVQTVLGLAVLGWKRRRAGFLSGCISDVIVGPRPRNWHNGCVKWTLWPVGRLKTLDGVRDGGTPAMIQNVLHIFIITIGTGRDTRHIRGKWSRRTVKRNFAGENLFSGGFVRIWLVFLVTTMVSDLFKYQISTAISNNVTKNHWQMYKRGRQKRYNKLTTTNNKHNNHNNNNNNNNNNNGSSQQYINLVALHQL